MEVDSLEVDNDEDAEVSLALRLDASAEPRLISEESREYDTVMVVSYWPQMTMYWLATTLVSTAQKGSSGSMQAKSQLACDNACDRCTCTTAAIWVTAL